MNMKDGDGMHLSPPPLEKEKKRKERMHLLTTTEISPRFVSIIMKALALTFRTVSRLRNSANDTYGSAANLLANRCFLFLAQRMFSSAVRCTYGVCQVPSHQSIPCIYILGTPYRTCMEYSKCTCTNTEYGVQYSE